MGALDYFLTADAAAHIGDIIRVPFRSQLLEAVIVAFPQTAEIPVSRIKSIHDLQVLTTMRAEGVQLLTLLSSLTHAPASHLLHALLPRPPKRTGPAHTPPHQTRPAGIAKERLIRGSAADRFAAYRNFHQEHGGQTIIAVPDIVRAEELARACAGQGLRAAVYHHRCAQTAAWRAWNALAEERADILITTKSGCLAPAPRLGGIIIDNEDDGDHVQRDAFPYMDAREAYVLRARITGAPILWASETPRFSTVWQTRASTQAAALPPQHPADVRIIPLRHETAALSRVRMSHAFIETARASIQSGRFVLCFLNRTQHAARLLCQSCGTLVRCTRCDMALALIDRVRARCPLCLSEQAVPESCTACGSTVLRERGLGVDQTAAAITTLLPGIPVAVRTRATPSGDLDKPGVVVVTETIWKNARPELQKLSLGALVAVDPDAGLSAPQYRATERAWASLERLAGLARAHNAPLFIHTRYEEHPLFTALRNDHPASILTPDLRERQAFHYPPFGSVLRIFVPKHERARGAELLRRAFPEADILAAEQPETRRAVRGSCPFLVRFPQASLNARISRLSHLPSTWIVEPDPND